MKYIFILLVAISAFNSNLSAQEKEYEDLWVLYIDEDYEKLMKKAISVTEDEKSRKEAMPYLFVAMANFEMSKDEKYAEDYPKAFKDACKYASRWRKKDKEGVTVYDNKDFIAELRQTGMEEAEGYVEDGSFSKAKSLYKYMAEFDPTDPGSMLMYAFVRKKLNDFSGSQESLNSFEEIMSSLGKLDSGSLRLLKYALIRYSEDLYREGNKTEAKAMIAKGKELFADDKEYNIVLGDLR
jgi:hypothetical protein